MVARPIDGLGHVDDFWIDARAHRFEHGFAGAFRGQIDRASAIEIERNAGFVRRDQRENYLTDIAAGEIMRFERIARNLDPCFDCGDSIIDNQSNRNAPQPHADHFSHADGRVGNARTQPNTEKVEKNDRQN